MKEKSVITPEKGLDKEEKMNSLIRFLSPTELWEIPSDDTQLDMFASYLITPDTIGCVVDEDHSDYFTLIGNKVLLVPKFSEGILYEAISGS
jgi:hypothetical protein